MHVTDNVNNVDDKRDNRSQTVAERRRRRLDYSNWMIEYTDVSVSSPGSAVSACRTCRHDLENTSNITWHVSIDARRRRRCCAAAAAAAAAAAQTITPSISYNRLFPNTAVWNLDRFQWIWLRFKQIQKWFVCMLVTALGDSLRRDSGWEKITKLWTAYDFRCDCEHMHILAYSYVHFSRYGF